GRLMVSWQPCARTRKRSAGKCGSSCRRSLARLPCSTMCRRRKCERYSKAGCNEDNVNLTDDERDLIALHLVTGIGPRLTSALLEHFGSASAILNASVPELLEVPYLGPKVAESLQRALANPDVAKECEQIARHGVHLSVLGRPGYPANLATIDDAPHLLFVKGGFEARDE